MWDEVLSEAAVRRPVVSDDDRLGLYPLDDRALECRTTTRRQDRGFDPSATFNGGKHCCSTTFAEFRGLRVPGGAGSEVAVPALLFARLPVHGRLIDLYITSQRLAVVFHGLVADLVEHPPCRPVGHAEGPL